MNTTFAVFGDIHGRITLMLLLARRWQAETGRTLDGVLQVGDFGAFPNVHKLDKATARHARDDTDELGFSEYLRGCDEGEQLLSEPGWPVVWMRGNHEDFDYLSQFQMPTAVDPWRRLFYLPDGRRFDLAGHTIGAMGGKPNLASKGRFRTDPTRVDMALANKAYADGNIDILLSHAAPDEVLDGGSAALSSLAHRVRPRVHLFGHHHIHQHPTPGPGDATVIGLDHLEFRRSGLRAGSWGILELGDRVRWTWGHTFPWTRALRRDTYRHQLA